MSFKSSSDTRSRPINVLVVDDSMVARELLSHVLESDPGISIIACANNGEEALALLARHKPDVITMDIHMPGMNGFEVTRRIMEAQPAPIVIVSSSYNREHVTMAFRAMEAGAVAVVEKPPGVADPSYPALAQKLISMIKAMAEVRVVRRWPKDFAARRATEAAASKTVLQQAAEIRLIAIGASTGGPPVLRTILAALPKPFPVPILIVQHISAGFVQGLADWLTSTTGMEVRIARHSELAVAGCAYLAPDGCHLRIDKTARLSCSADQPASGLRPSVSCLFRSVLDAFGAHGLGVLLTGMGRDGADELKLMKDRGAVTIAQDEATSVVYGMPGEAVRIGAAMYVQPANRIASTIHALVGAPRPVAAKAR
jgi:two-component system, chemotaxis family, protein-glutamate methylesterase/glutaminase